MRNIFCKYATEYTTHQHKCMCDTNLGPSSCWAPYAIHIRGERLCDPQIVKLYIFYTGQDNSHVVI